MSEIIKRKIMGEEVTNIQIWRNLIDLNLEKEKGMNHLFIKPWWKVIQHPPNQKPQDPLLRLQIMTWKKTKKSKKMIWLEIIFHHPRHLHRKND